MSCATKLENAPREAMKSPNDKMFRWTAIKRAAPTRRDPAAYIAECRDASYYDDGEFIIMPLDKAQAITAKWRTPAERLKARGIVFAGPGTVLARWIHVAALVLSLGLVSIQCSRCAGRANKLDSIGWTGLPRTAWRRIANARKVQD